MARSENTQSTGKAPIIRQGHTASTKNGANPNVQERGDRSVRDLSAK